MIEDNLWLIDINELYLSLNKGIKGNTPQTSILGCSRVCLRISINSNANEMQSTDTSKIW